MKRPRIGSTVIDTRRRDLGRGVLQFWGKQPHIGEYARVKFAVGLRLVRVDNCQAVKHVTWRSGITTAANT